MKNVIIKRLLALLMTLLSKDLVKRVFDKIEDYVDTTENPYDDMVVDALMQSPELIDGVLDFIEDTVEGSSNVYDDIVVLPVCSMIREVLGVEDDDD